MNSPQLWLSPQDLHKIDLSTLHHGYQELLWDFTLSLRNYWEFIVVRGGDIIFSRDGATDKFVLTPVTNLSFMLLSKKFWLNSENQTLKEGMKIGRGLIGKGILEDEGKKESGDGKNLMFIM